MAKMGSQFLPSASAAFPPSARAPRRRCERAVVTAYSELRAVGFDELGAFRSCVTLYRIHHPEADLSEARSLVSKWIDQHINTAAFG